MIQTIDRIYYAPAKAKHDAPPCERREDKLRLTATDRLRLDVAQGTWDEINSWPGASRFDMTDIDQIVDHGPFGTGSFGGYLLDIFDNNDVRYDYRGETMRDGKRLFVYSYQLTRSASHYQIRTYSSWTTTGYSGTFEVHPESLEIERVIIQTPQLPPETRLCEAESTLDYERVQIGDGIFLLPRQSQLHLIARNGEETNNTTVFSDCREYMAHSTVSFGATPTAAHDTPVIQTSQPEGSPRRYFVELRFNDAIDTEKSAAGDPISATFVHDVHPYQSKEVVIPAGAVAHGRVSRIEHHFVPYEFVTIGISFQSLEVGGKTSPFTAKPIAPVAVTQLMNGANAPAPQVRTPIGPPNSFVFPYEKHHVMAVGSVSQWVTMYPPPVQAK